MVVKQLLRPFAFRTIDHPQLRPLVTWVPAVCSMVTVAVFYVLPVSPATLGDKGITGYILSVLTILPGFYIAALAAVATFDKKELDFIMDDPAPKLELVTRGESSLEELTTRMFLCHMFAYLTALSFVTVILCIAGNIIGPSMNVFEAALIPPAYVPFAHMALEITFLLMVIWLSAQIILVTMMGLYFLAERIHRPNA